MQAGFGPLGRVKWDLKQPFTTRVSKTTLPLRIISTGASNFDILHANGPFTGDEMAISKQDGISKEIFVGGKADVSARLLTPSDSNDSWPSGDVGFWLGGV